MTRPLIGITTHFRDEGDEDVRQRVVLNAAYTDAIYAAGGTPLPLSPPAERDPAVFDELLRRCDGLLFSGGDDLDPRHYGQAPHARTTVMHRRRDAFDLEFFRRADERAIPILSICLGCQVTSVARGGCLIQHVDDVKRPEPVTHHLPGGASAYHDVEVSPDSQLAKITGKTRFQVNSRHHQALDRAQFGGRLRPVAFATDGVVEAVEDFAGRFLLAVQWHPEDLIDRPEQLALFRALVDAARSG